MRLTYLSVCSGIEAASVAWEALGWVPLVFSEIEPFPSAVLKHHWPDVPNLGDFTAILPSHLEARPDVLIGGTPCQAFSVAGLRQSLEDDRGNLALEFVRLADRVCPDFVVWENVPGVLSTKDNAFGCFLGALVGAGGALSPSGRRWPGAGLVSGPARRACWRVLDAQFFGVAQRRRRVFVVACPSDGPDPAEVLLECESVRRDSAPCREAGEGAAARAGDGLEGRRWPAELAATLRSENGSPGYADQDLFSHGGANLVPDAAHTLRGEGFDASEDGTGRGTPLVAARMAAFGEYVDDGTASTVKARDHKDATDLVVQPLCMAPAFSKRPRQQIATRDDGVSYAMTTGEPPRVLASGMAVRRLTPTECERLQGFPDGHSAIPWRGKQPHECPDGPRYKAIGNSMAVPVIAWIGRRIEEVLSAFEREGPRAP